MGDNVVLKKILRYENVLGVYRNNNLLSITRCILLWTRQVIEIILYVYIICHKFIYQIYYGRNDFGTAFAISLTMNSFIIFLISLVTLQKFKLLIERIEKNEMYISNDAVYKTNMQRKCNIIKLYAVLCAITLSWLEIHINALRFVKFKDVYFIGRIIILTVCSVRFVLEILVLHCVLFILSEQTKYITRKFSGNDIFIASRQAAVNEVILTADLIPEINFEQCTDLYMNIKECSNLFNAVFGAEITYLLLMIIANVITNLYNVIYINTKEYLDDYAYFLVGVFCARSLGLLVALFVLCVSAQTAKNRVNDLRRRLAKVLIESVANEQYYAEVKTFLRIVSNPPFKTMAFGSIEVDMSLLPNFIMFIVSNTVIALQYNNVF